MEKIFFIGNIYCLKVDVKVEENNCFFYNGQYNTNIK